MCGIPLEAEEVTKEDVQSCFPTDQVLEAWSKGDLVSWPPDDEEGLDDGMVDFPPVRFTVGTRVECCVGAEQWALGTIVQVWYREPHWPKNSWAPYKIHLDDGRFIFAPGDVDQVIRSVGSRVPVVE